MLSGNPKRKELVKIVAFAFLFFLGRPRSLFFLDHKIKLQEMSLCPRAGRKRSWKQAFVGHSCTKVSAVKGELGDKKREMGDQISGPRQVVCLEMSHWSEIWAEADSSWAIARNDMMQRTTLMVTITSERESL